MSITFGSVGDIIAVCLSVKDLIDVLDRSRESSADYQGLIRELSSLDRALLEIDLLFRTHGNSGGLKDLLTIAKDVVEKCQQSLNDLTIRVRKYDASLRGSGSGNKLKDGVMKLKWRLSEGDAIAKFRSTVAIHGDALNMLLATANVKLLATGNNMLEDLNSAAQDLKNKQDDLSAKMQSQQLTSQADISGFRTSLNIMASTLKWLRDTCNGMTGSLNQLLSLGKAIHTIVVSIQTSLPSRIEMSLIEEPFILEDAIGRIAPVHLQFIDSWDAFQSVIEHRFNGLQGYEKVLRQEFVLQEHATRRDICRSRPWKSCFLPGQRVDMSLIFTNEQTASDVRQPTTTCPGCHFETASTTNMDVQWQVTPILESNIAYSGSSRIRSINED